MSASSFVTAISFRPQYRKKSLPITICPPHVYLTYLCRAGVMHAVRIPSGCIRRRGVPCVVIVARGHALHACRQAMHQQLWGIIEANQGSVNISQAATDLCRQAGHLLQAKVLSFARATILPSVSKHARATCSRLRTLQAEALASCTASDRWRPVSSNLLAAGAPQGSLEKSCSGCRAVGSQRNGPRHLLRCCSSQHHCV